MDAKQAAYPPDGHVHTEFSWDAPGGSMERTCARAVELGLPSIAFTEHADFAVWTPLDPSRDLPDWLTRHRRADGAIVPPKLDVEGYLACVERCRDRFGGLRILSGVELSEPHWHPNETADLIDLGRFDRRLGSVHSVRHTDESARDWELEASEAYDLLDAETVVREYLAEVARLAAGSDAFDVLAHIDFPIRYWPASAGPWSPCPFEAEYRHALRTLAGTDRAMEVNTQVPLHPVIVQWWREEGGQTLTFGSDAHSPDALAKGLREAAAMVEAAGFRSGRHPFDLWVRA
jgi:histidinol-phosphatase (PHP family)